MLVSTSLETSPGIISRTKSNLLGLLLRPSKGRKGFGKQGAEERINPSVFWFHLKIGPHTKSSSRSRRSSRIASKRRFRGTFKRLLKMQSSPDKWHGSFCFVICAGYALESNKFLATELFERDIQMYRSRSCSTDRSLGSQTRENLRESIAKNLGQIKKRRTQAEQEWTL